MKRVMLGLSMLLFSSFNLLWAQASPQDQEFLESLRVGAPEKRASQVIPGQDQVALEKSRSLFFELAGQDLHGVAVPVEFKVRVDGKPFLQERLTVEVQDSGPTPAVEFLALDGDRLAKLYDLAARNKEVRIAVLIDGRRIREFSFAQFVKYNRSLKANLHPVVAVSTTVTPARSEQAGPAGGGLTKGYLACRQNCFNAWQNCLRYCERFPRYMCEESCDSRYDTCLATCTCPTTTTYDGSPEFVGYTLTGYEVCLNREFFSGIRWHTELYRTYKVTQYERTENCDGSVTTTPIGYYYVYECCCYLETFEACSFSGGTPLCYAH